MNLSDRQLIWRMFCRILRLCSCGKSLGESLWSAARILYLSWINGLESRSLDTLQRISKIRHRTTVHHLEGQGPYFLFWQEKTILLVNTVFFDVLDRFHLLCKRDDMYEFSWTDCHFPPWTSNLSPSMSMNSLNGCETSWLELRCRPVQLFLFTTVEGHLALKSCT